MRRQPRRRDAGADDDGDEERRAAVLGQRASGQRWAHEQQSAENSSLSASTVYSSHAPSGPSTHTFSWAAKQHVPEPSTGAKPSAASLAWWAATSSVDSSSMPRWFSRVAGAAFSNRTSLSGGSAMAKLA